jgi:hypothetical protein
MRSRFSPRAAVAALVTGLLLTACGPGGSTGSAPANQPEAPKVTPLEAITLAAAKTTEAKTAKFTMTVKAVEGSKQPEVFTADGVMDYANNKVEMTVQAADGTTRMVMDGNVYYISVPGDEVLPGKSWLKMDIGALAEAAGVDLGSLPQSATNDPTQALAFLKGVSDDVREVGKEQVRGTETTHYAATIDLLKAVEQQAPEQKEQLEQALKQVEMTSAPAHIWVDAEGRARKLQYNLTGKDAGGKGGDASTDLSIEMFEFGTPVTVTKPPANQTVDFAAFLEELKKLQQG